MSNFEKQQLSLSERKTAHRKRMEEEAKLCFDLAKLCFAGVVLTSFYSFIRGEIPLDVSLYGILIGILVMAGLISLGDNFLKV